jgi:hypothetical protein
MKMNLIGCLDQIRYNWFNFDQIWSSCLQFSWFKMVLISSNWFKLDQKDQNESDWLFGSNQIKLVQIGLNQIYN